MLFPPKDLPKLYYLGRAKGTLHYSYPNNFTRDLSSLDKRAIVFGSSILVDHPNYDRFPLFKDTIATRVIIQPGDTLYLPPFWHHEVQSMPDERVGVSLAANFWFANVTFPIDDVAMLNIKMS